MTHRRGSLFAYFLVCRSVIAFLLSPLTHAVMCSADDVRQGLRIRVVLQSPPPPKPATSKSIELRMFSCEASLSSTILATVATLGQELDTVKAANMQPLYGTEGTVNESISLFAQVLLSQESPSTVLIVSR